MTWWGIGVTAVGAAVNLYGQNKAKKAGEADAQFNAEQLRARADISRATGQRVAEEERRQARLLESAVQARAGGGGLDPTVLKLQADIAGEGEFRALSALYEGETGALGNEASADSGLRSQRARSSAADYAMASTLLSSAGSLYSKYNDRPKGPK